MRSVLSLLIVGLLLFQACDTKQEEENNETMKERPDAHSFSMPDDAVLTHLDWEAFIDFEAQVIKGKASWSFEKSANAEQIILDTWKLNILGVSDQIGEPLEFSLSEEDDHLGQALTIALTEGTEQVVINYESNPEAKALQWLAPVQTLGKESPFLFSQSQAILARSWIPCQDSPGIRFTYNAKVEVPQGLMAVMSARNPQKKNNTGVYEFDMPQSIPSYLLALSVGDFEFSSIGERTGIYAEEGILEDAVYEFADMEKMLIAAEELYGPYAWERYDLIVLPPSFPFGGMENPRITFATPTVIAGDRSLTALVAHELAHSWSGNVVTNSNWDDFWLNEGFTVYFERRIMEALYGAPYSEMLAILGYYDLEETVNDLGKENADTKLKLSLKDRDPDEGMTDIAYEKGYFLLREIENTVGRQEFDVFLNNYFEKFAFKPMTTEKFMDYLFSSFPDLKSSESLNVDAWVYGPGIPEISYFPESDRLKTVEELSAGFIELGKLQEGTMKDWSTAEWLKFLRSLPESLTTDQINDLESSFSLSKSGNSEIFYSWAKKCIASEYDEILPEVDSFLSRVGRRKFVLPLFEELIRKEKYMEFAEQLYKRNRDNYHSVTYLSVDKAFEELANN